MRIGLVHPYSWPDVRRGGERYLDDLASYLAGDGHTVDIITGTDGRSSMEARSDGAVVRRLRHFVPLRAPMFGLTKVDTFGIPALPRLLKNRYDVVHAFTPSAAIAARLARQRVVYTVLGHPTPDQFGIRPGDLRLVRRAVHSATLPVALSPASALAVESMFGRRPDVLPPGVRTDRFTPGPPVEDRATRPRDGTPHVLFSGDADDPRKGLGIVLDAFARLLAARPHARLALSGPGDHHGAVARLGPAIEALGVGDLDDVSARYRAATVTVLPSRHEAFGLALVESLACGTPVVCFDDGGMPEIVGPPEAGCGFVVPPGDIAALARALDDAIDLAGRADTPERCVTRARRWDWASAVGPMHVATYESLLV